MSVVRYVALATGFDGTLARQGRCDPRSVAMLRALAASGRKLILVTSRELREVLDVFRKQACSTISSPENGAVVHHPAARESQILAPAPSEMLVHELRRRQVEPLSVGSVAVATSSDYRRRHACGDHSDSWELPIAISSTTARSVAALPTRA